MVWWRFFGDRWCGGVFLVVRWYFCAVVAFLWWCGGVFVFWFC